MGVVDTFRLCHFGARVDKNINLSKFFWWFEAVVTEDPDARDITQYVKCKQFSIFEEKEAVEVIEVSDFIMSDEVIEATEVFKTPSMLAINKLMAKIIFFWCLEKKI